MRGVVPQQDLVYASRALRRNPSFSLAVIATLALGIGANTAIFSVVNGVLLRPLPYDAPERQVRVQVLMESRTGPPDVRALNLTVADTQTLARESRSLEHVGNVGFSLTNWRGREPRWSGAEISASVFPMLGVRPSAGRFFVPDDELEGAVDVIVISYRAWTRHFAGQQRALGQIIGLEPALGDPGPSTPYTIVGVAPPGFDYLPGSSAQYWIPLKRSDRGSVVARLAPGVTAAAALAEIEPLVRTLQAQAPGPRPLGYRVAELHDLLVAPVRTSMLMLMGAVGIVLLIACVNVSNLILTRSLARRREIAVRKAIGATSGHILRLVMYESLLLTGVAAVLAVAFAGGGVAIFRQLASTMDRIDLGQGGGRLIPLLDAVGVDWRVLAFTLGVAAAVAVLMGIIPALQLRRHSPIAAVSARSDPGISGSRLRPGRVRGVLIVAQVALSIVLLVGGGLVIGSFVALMRVNTGYEVGRLLTFQVSLPSDKYPLPKLTTFAETVVERLESTPGVSAAAYAKQLPLVALRDTLRVARTPGAGAPGTQGADARFVSRQYFNTLGVRVLAGRGFAQGDDAGQPKVLVINESLAKREFGDAAAAVGQQAYVAADPTPWLIVGVVADLRLMGLHAAPIPQFFIDARQWMPGLSPAFPLSPYYAVRFNGDEGTAVAAITTAIRESEREGLIFNLARMEDIVSSTVARPRMYAVVLGTFAAVGVAMALIGIYSVMSYTVSQQTREIGIRMALGARPGLLRTQVLRHALVLTVIGIAAGLVAARAVSRSLESMLFGLTPLDVPTFAGVAVLFVVFAALAAYVPASRASKVDPLVAIRTE